MRLEGKIVYDGEAKGRALVTKEPISFLGGIDPDTGKVVEPGHELGGKSIEGRVLVFPHGKGSTVGSYVIYQLASNGKAPAAMINRAAEPIVATGAIIAKIPMIHELDRDPVNTIGNQDLVTIQGNNVLVERK